MKKIFRFFDLLEDRIRHNLSHFPLLYALVGFIGVVLIWRGIWHIADDFMMNAWVSVILGVLILISSGLFVALAIGDEVIINAFRGRRKVTELKLEETLTLSERVDEIKQTLEKIERSLSHVEKEEKKIEKEVAEN
jgi:hypothetical protein